MSTGRTMAAVAGVVLLSLLAAVTYGLGEPDGSGDPVVFVQVWLAGSVVGVTLVLVVGLVAAAAVEPARLVPLRRRRRSNQGASGAQNPIKRGAPSPGTQERGNRSIDGLRTAESPLGRPQGRPCISPRTAPRHQPDPLEG